MSSSVKLITHYLGILFGLWRKNSSAMEVSCQKYTACHNNNHALNVSHQRLLAEPTDTGKSCGIFNIQTPNCCCVPLQLSLSTMQYTQYRLYRLLCCCLPSSACPPHTAAFLTELSFQIFLSYAMVLFMWQENIIGVAQFLEACHA